MRFFRFLISSGMVPDMLFKLNHNVSSLDGRLLIELGKFPFMLFDMRHNFVNWVHLLKEDRKVQL